MKYYLAIVLTVSLLSSMVYADAAKGLKIAQEVERRDTGWKDATAVLKMVLRNQQGDESTRDVRLKTLEVDGDGDKSLTIFDSPRDIKGSSFLSFSHAVTPDDQWLYLPALKRVKRVSSSNKSGPFMGSQFAYEDLASFEVDKYEYKYLRDEKLGDKETLVIENYPKYAYSGYKRQIVWIDKQHYIPLQIEYYDRKDALLKTLRFNQYHQYLNQYWRAQEQVMENHQNGKTTVLTISDYQLRTGLEDRDFQKTSLKRLR